MYNNNNINNNNNKYNCNNMLLLKGGYGFKTTEKWYHHKPESVMENSKAQILWDMCRQTNHVIQAR